MKNTNNFDVELTIFDQYTKIDNVYFQYRDFIYYNALPKSIELICKRNNCKFENNFIIFNSEKKLEIDNKEKNLFCIKLLNSNLQLSELINFSLELKHLLESLIYFEIEIKFVLNQNT